MPDFEESIREVYITPIRSVIALDDCFPTLDGFLSHDVEESKSDAGLDDERHHLKEILRFCREKPWIVDVHNGKEIVGENENELIKHLHQTDLLILDYKLQGDELGGERAINILRQLAENPHFNLVVVYTKENPVNVFREIVPALFAPCKYEFEQHREQEIEDFWTDLRSRDDINVVRFEEMIDVVGYARAREIEAAPSGETILEAIAPLNGLEEITGELLNTAGLTRPLSQHELVEWLFRRFERGMNNALNGENGLMQLSICENPLPECNWLRTDRLFLTVVKKTEVQNEIINRLEGALQSWHPTPHRLILSKIRAALESSGGEFEEKALSDRHVQAGLLYQLLSDEEKAIQSGVADLVARHWDAVLRGLQSEVTNFAVHVVERERREGSPREVVDRHYGKWLGEVDKKTEIEISNRLNAYVSTQPISGYHMQTGHIFGVDDELWVCMSPMCDLSPGRSQSDSWRTRLGANLPFLAVRLFESPEDGKHTVGAKEKTLKRATSGEVVFLEVDGEIRSYSFVRDSGGSPRWEQMLVTNDGFLDSGSTFGLVRFRHDDYFGIQTRAQKCVPIVGQLRYEYALHLLQLLGQNMSRVGLDYVRKLTF